MAYLFQMSALDTFRDVNGDLMPGSTLSFYNEGTTVAASTYTDETGDTEHTWPVEADVNGVFPAIYLLNDAAYRVKLKDAGGNTLRDRDNIKLSYPSTVATDAEVAAIASGLNDDMAQLSTDLNAAMVDLETELRDLFTTGYPEYWGLTIAGQSNASGTTETVLTTAQAFSNLKLSGSSLIALVEASVETVASGSTAHASSRALEDMPPGPDFPQTWVTSNFGSGATAIAGISQGTAPYIAGLAAVTAKKAAAVTAGKTYAEMGMLFIHGETDANSSTTKAAYLAALIQLKDDWNTDVIAITGQTNRIPMFVEQVAYGDSYANTTGPMLAMLEAAETDDEIILVQPGYIYRFRNDGLHFLAHDMRRLGESFGEALHRHYVVGRTPGTVRPLTWTRIGSRTVELTFYVPTPPLVFDLDQVWPPDAGLGFTVYASGGSEIPIEGAWLTGPNTVRVLVAAGEVVAAGDRITYALKNFTDGVTGGLGAGNTRGPRGCLRDSDATPSYYSDALGGQYRLENWCAAFTKTLS